jgi:hypothetical protein
MKTSATRGTKRKSIDLVLGDHFEQDSLICISKVIWDKDDEVDDDTDTDDSETDVTEEFENSDKVDDTETNNIQDFQTEDV